ncbi:hypothetical protein NX009_21650 [Klebsiella pneumoniae]|nr:hypothetical protein [Klebsiella pneumoniae]
MGTTNAALAKKAEAAAVTALTQQVEQNGQDIRSNTDSITSLSNQLVNGQPNRWSRRLYPVQLANAGTVPSFSDVRAVAPTVVDEVADAAKLDFTSAGKQLSDRAVFLPGESGRRYHHHTGARRQGF